MVRLRQRRRPVRGWSRWGRIWRLSLVLGILLFVILAALTLWPWEVEPPADVETPGVVYVTDYGRHSRLAIQVDQDSMLEYSFGDWRYYVLEERTVWRGVVALTLPTHSGLGRRALPWIDDTERFGRIAGTKRVLRLEVEREKIDELLRELDARYRANLETEVEPEWTTMTFVADETPYHLFWNSNTQTAEFLRRLGCEVRGFPILSNFRD